MKKIFLPFMFFSLSLGSFSQTVDEVIAKHTEAMGGKEKLAALKSVYMETVSVMNGNEATAKLWKVHNQLMRREFNFGMGTVTMVMTDKEGWSSNPRSGGKFEPMPADAVLSQQSELDCAGPLVDYAAKGHAAQLIGKEDVNGVSAHVVKLTLKSGRDITYYLDPSTYYILRSKTKGGGMRRGAGANPDAETMVEYSDYQKTPEGYVFPYATTIVGMGAATNVEKIEVNKPVDAKLFKPE